MARINYPGVAEAVWVTTTTDYTIMTASEANAGTDLTGFVRGVPSIPETGNTADTADLSSKFNKRIAASFGGDNLSMTIYLDDVTDTAYELLTRSTSGYLVVAWYGLATPGTFAIGDDIWIYPAQVLSRPVDPVGRDDAAVSTVEIAITDVPEEKFAIAA